MVVNSNNVHRLSAWIGPIPDWARHSFLHCLRGWLHFGNEHLTDTQAMACRIAPFSLVLFFQFAKLFTNFNMHFIHDTFLFFSTCEWLFRSSSSRLTTFQQKALLLMELDTIHLRSPWPPRYFRRHSHVKLATRKSKDKIISLKDNTKVISQRSTIFIIPMP